MNNIYMTVSETNHLKAMIVGAGYNITSLASAIGMGREILSARIKRNPQDIFFASTVTRNEAA